MRRFVAVPVALVVVVLTQVVAGASPHVLQPPTEDHGMFLNILPAGQGQSTTGQDYLQYQATGTPPAHDTDQQKMYESLPVADLSKLTDGDLSKYYKPETFLPPTGSDITSTQTPETGLTILRDTFGVPHIYGDTRSEAMFGAGYASAQDRLFMMDVLRHVGEGHLSELLGPSAANLQMDEASYQVAGYSPQELQAQVDRLHQFGPDGDQVIQDVTDFVAGINQRINDDMSDPSQMPAEYGALQIQPTTWSPGDVVAVAILIQATFAGGGGSELQNAMFLQDAQKKLGPKKGQSLWRDMRQAEDPTAPVTADTRFNYLASRKVDKKSLAMPDPKSVKQSQVVSCTCGSSANAPNFHGQSPVQLLRNGLTRLGLMVPDGASNWIGVTKNHTKSGHPIAVMGPQVGYWSPQILMEMDIHAPGLDARGATFPGISLYVLLGRGADYAWSATSGESDLIDVRAEQLCNKDGSAPTTSSTAYMFNGTCTDMIQRTDSWLAKPSAGGTGPPSQVTASVVRTVHGPVFATGTVGGKPVAFSLQRSTFGGELDSAISFVQLSDGRVTNPATFQQAMSNLTGSFNWLYVDDQHLAYYHSGLYPIRATGVDPALPSWGTGKWEWQGFVKAADHPQEVDPKKGWIASWNNKPAHGWRAADSQWSYGPVHRVQMLTKQLEQRVPKGNVTAADMVAIMANAATIDLRGQADLPLLLKLVRGDAKDKKILNLMQAWLKTGTHRIDRNGDGSYENHSAVAFMDAWWPLLVHKMFDGQLAGLYDDSVSPIDMHPGPNGSSFQNGFYGYVQKTIEMALGAHVTHPYKVLRCADGTLKGCRKAVIASIRAAMKQLGNDMSTWDAHETTDQIQFSAVGVVSVPNMPWQNRPTFQQVVEVSSHR